jgi:transcriptional regulator with XRE-family HTH domain
MADWYTIFGQAVRQRRQRLGLTLNEASAAIGISRSHLNLIELGKPTGVSRECAERIDGGLGARGALLALLPPSGAESAVESMARVEEMRRKEFNKAVLAIGAALLLDPERLIDSSTVDPVLLFDLESLTSDFARRQHYASPQAILGPLRAHLRHLLDLEGGRLSPALRPRLARVTAETAGVAGWVAFRGAGDLPTAHAQLALAREHAGRAGDNELVAQLLAVSSSLYSSLDIPDLDGTRDSALSLSLLRAAQRKAGGKLTPLQGWLSARVAVEQALLGDGRRARAALSRAEAATPSHLPADPTGLFFVVWNEARLPGYTGKALLLLGDPAAVNLLEQALTATSAPHPRFGLLVDLAMASTTTRDPDRSVTLLLQAAQLAVERGIDRFGRWRLREGRARLPVAQRQDFDRQLSALA